MQQLPWPELGLLYEKAYHEAISLHGDLAVNFITYVARLDAVVSHQLTSGFSLSEALACFERLHTGDLYLAMACAQASEAAWRRFSLLYQQPAREVARRIIPSRSQADELADSAMGHVFLPDTAGRCRIASFDGRSSLGFWLAVVVKRLSLKERQRGGNRLEQLSDHVELIDDQSLARMEAGVRRARYRRLIHQALPQLSAKLSARELLIVRLHYLEGLKASEIARLLDVNRSSITRQLERTHGKLKNEIITGLRTQNRLTFAAVEECIAEMVADPEYAVLAMRAVA
ncbi:MAG TPA: sigma-70 family RNA polymerase sigma factor [Blastocatellia bacterium]|nr:sigma-70 family RNA polymerase sigma factor [Blastocatellia bacterium]